MSLTPTQSGYAACILDGLGPKQAAKAMGVKPTTARTHLQRLRERFGARNLVQLALILKGMELQNRYNWFPICTFIIGLPGETREDTKQSLDLLYALKDSKWVVVPTLFVPLEDTRLGAKESAKIFNLTDLQWEFFFTCWRYNLDFWRKERSTQWKFNVGIPFYYYLMGRRTFGSALKYPLFRLAHFPEWFLRRKLYLDFSGRMQPRWMAPDMIPIPGHHHRPLITDLSAMSQPPDQLQFP